MREVVGFRQFLFFRERLRAGAFITEFEIAGYRSRVGSLAGWSNVGVFWGT
jgi:hypothetical protein